MTDVSESPNGAKHGFILKRFLKKILIFMAVLTTFSKAYANDTPNAVYILLREPPTSVFITGLVGSGSNYNLLDLFSGSSLIRNTTAYVVTSANLEGTLERVRALIENETAGQPCDYWLYTITPNDTFYNVYNSLFNSALAVRNRDPNLYRRLNIAIVTLLSNHLRWWVTTWIRQSQIVSATRYALQNNELVAVDVRGNPNYIPMQPAVNPDFIPITGSTDQYVFYQELGAVRILAAPLCQSFSSQTEHKSAITDYGVCTKHTYQELELKLIRNLILLTD